MKTQGVIIPRLKSWYTGRLLNHNNERNATMIPKCPLKRALDFISGMTLLALWGIYEYLKLLKKRYEEKRDDKTT
jgi:hypothetical protein